MQVNGDIGVMYHRSDGGTGGKCDISKGMVMVSVANQERRRGKQHKY